MDLPGNGGNYGICVERRQIITQPSNDWWRKQNEKNPKSLELKRVNGAGK